MVGQTSFEHSNAIHFLVMELVEGNPWLSG